MHTARQLGEMLSDNDVGVKRFSESALALARDICLPYRAMLVERADDPSNGFVFRSQTCSGGCGSGTRCSYCASRTMPDVDGRVGKRGATIQHTNNPTLAANEILVLRKENRELRSQLARAARLNDIV